MNREYIYQGVFVWDEKKAKENLKKHQVSFELACRVFNDPALYVLYDASNSTDEEERYICIGNIGDGLTVLSVAMTERAPYTRIISARKATRRERESYEKNARSIQND